MSYLSIKVAIAMSTEQNKPTDVQIQEDEGSWVKPEVTSYAPVKAAEGISYNPTDGISNLTA